MTESYISPQDLAQYYSAQDRVRNWVSTHADHVFTSPNIPPSELDDQDALSSAPSDVESSHSIPPRLMLRYPDGRESPIPHRQKDSSSGQHSRSRSNQQSQQSPQRSRSGSIPSAAEISMLDHRREREKLSSNSPEEIRILPSASDQTPPLSSGSHHSRSRSLPRDTFSPSRTHDPMPVPHSPPHSSHHTAAYAATPPDMTEMSPPVIPVIPSPGINPGIARTQPAPTHWNPYGSAVRAGPMMPPSREHFKHNPPSIVYAPSHNSRTNYHPPAILSYRPVGGPNRIFYSHSVPPSQAQIANAGYPSVHGTHAPPEERVHRHKRASESNHRDRSAGSGKSNTSKSTTGRRSGRDRSRSLPLEQDYPPPLPTEHHRHHRHHHHHRHHARSPSPAGSDGSGSTYYVLPTARQKVHVLRSPDTLYTATSTTQSPTTPISPTGSIKKPFLQRILGGFAERFSTSGSSKGSLRRRHSTGTRSTDPVSEH
ncbi:hypothetical protein GYMLUDRAFT_61126 [Collybiopsis luxurians FD-317 M1]|uniref:Uncharacterized protein n=1 Tax=Collybiopsis luxurians FD-317 M1 TaxID=944289 RepID=A0A0D0CQJ7_9AGAR|nr:hypothetical protein GYMLUDRAFT_61126 [Collybiopsis luxurians FD-317 M1]